MKQVHLEQGQCEVPVRHVREGVKEAIRGHGEV